MSFNPNELVLERVRAVTTYDLADGSALLRLTSVEEPSLKTSAEGTEVTDAMGSLITTFYKTQKAQFDATNSLLSLDLVKEQFGSKKVSGTEDAKIKIPVSETLEMAADHTITLSHTPTGTTGAEIKYVYEINEDNSFGKKYEVAATAGTGKFTIDAASRKITLPNDTVGKIYADYEYETVNAVKITKTTNSIPTVQRAVIDVIFRNVCNSNVVYAGKIVCPRVQLDPSSVELALNSAGKHPFSMIMQKDYCSESGTLFDIIVSED